MLAVGGDEFLNHYCKRRRRGLQTVPMVRHERNTDDGNITYTARRQYGPINTFSCKLTAQSTAPEIRFFAGPKMVEERLGQDGPTPGFHDSSGKTDVRGAGKRRAAPITAKVKAQAKAKPKASTKATNATGSRHQAS